MSMAANSTELVAPNAGEIIEFGSFRHPETVMREAELVAKTFKARADQLQLYKKIGPSKHLLIEGWQTLAAMYRVTAGLVEDRYIEFGDAHGFEAMAEAIFVPTQQRISTAKAMCLSDEENWGMRPKYEWKNNERVHVGFTPTPLQQLRSMAQTRANSKVLSNLLKWVARMAGFAATPAEEIPDGDGGKESRSQNIRPPQQKQSPPPTQPQHQTKTENGTPAKINTKQLQRIFAIAHTANKSNEEVRNICKYFGFPTPDDVTVDKYDAICAEIERGDAQ
jgi:hypothetical protein